MYLQWRKLYQKFVARIGCNKNNTWRWVICGYISQNTYLEMYVTLDGCARFEISLEHFLSSTSSCKITCRMWEWKVIRFVSGLKKWWTSVRMVRWFLLIFLICGSPKIHQHRKTQKKEINVLFSVGEIREILATVSEAGAALTTRYVFVRIFKSFSVELLLLYKSWKQELQY